MRYNNSGAVIVAGGLSSRMKGFKPFMNIGNNSIIETTINNYKLLGVKTIVVVTGFRAIDIEEKLKNYNIIMVSNENYKTTHMFDSVCIGLRELNNACDKSFVTPVDSPFVQQFTLKKMIEEMDEFSLDIVQPSYKGRNGHPLLLSNNGIDIMLNHDGYMGMRGAISNTKNYKNINFADAGIVLDADNMCDYLKLTEYYEHRFSYKEKLYSNDDEICSSINKRKDQALKLYSMILSADN